MKIKACGFEFEIVDRLLHIYLPEGKFEVELIDAVRLGSYISHEGFLDNTNVYGFRIFNTENQELQYNQLNERFCVS